MHSDPIADMLTRMRNALFVGKKEVWVPYSRIKFEILSLLQKEGWIEAVEKVPVRSVKVPRSAKKKVRMRARFAQIKVGLKYDEQTRQPVIRSLKRVSKPSRRIYVGKDEIPNVLNGFGVAVLSTSQGIITNAEARKRGIGGEIICEVY